jgi:hypothetical protein
MVIDARVSCQRPQLENISITLDSSTYILEGFFSRTENISPIAGSENRTHFFCRVGFREPGMDGIKELTICSAAPATGFPYFNNTQLLSDLQDPEWWNGPDGRVPRYTSPYTAVWLIIKTSLAFSRNHMAKLPSTTS